MDPFSRKSSFKSMIYRSLRIQKKPKPPKPTVAREPSVFLVRRASTDNLEVLNPIREKPPAPLFPVRSARVAPCGLVQFRVGVDVKPYDKDCRLTSFERKYRSHKIFGVGLHAHQQLLCPQQASHIEVHFTTSCSSDVVVQVQAPNGELSNFLRPARDQDIFFNPAKVGCGHGVWRIDIAVRVGCRFRHVRSEEIFLQGQGILFYNIEPNATLRLNERLWLNWTK
ncbi:hypothetical protein Q1695_001146 [Nippostrongylus brasiliensis]|nr:hypothetical protein Q1695_001146 [Nippostrongylus brasiliensis]